jgi:hypothetical protein
MRRVQLIHWNAPEAEERIARIRAAGYNVAYEPLAPDTLRELSAHPPAAVVIDLARLPTQGRDVGLAIRHSKSTRHVPLVFVDGDAEKVARIRKSLPDATYTSWGRIRNTLQRAISHPLSEPVVPRSVLDGYSGVPLVRKLGIKARSMVALIDAPRGFEKILGKLPEGAKLRRNTTGKRDLTIWFTRSRKDLERRISQIARSIENGGMWIAWPKKTSEIAADLSQVDVRKVGLAAGLVDYKICSIDDTWSGLRFSRRRSR